MNRSRVSTRKRPRKSCGFCSSSRAPIASLSSACCIRWNLPTPMPIASSASATDAWCSTCRVVRSRAKPCIGSIFQKQHERRSRTSSAARLGQPGVAPRLGQRDALRDRVVGPCHRCASIPRRSGASAGPRYRHSWHGRPDQTRHATGLLAAARNALAGLADGGYRAVRHFGRNHYCAAARASRCREYDARALIGFTQAVPDLVWALLFVTAVGLGPFPGGLALGVHSVGMLGRLFAETIEQMDMAPIHALELTGARRIQVFSHGIIPSILPSLLGITLYRLDENIRSSLVLGFVGAGGIGFQLLTAMNLFQYQEVSLLLIIIFVIVPGAERISAELRQRLS